MSGEALSVQLLAPIFWQAGDKHKLLSGKVGIILTSMRGRRRRKGKKMWGYSQEQSKFIDLFSDLAQALGVGQKDTKPPSRSIHLEPTRNERKQEKFTRPLLHSNY